MSGRVLHTIEPFFDKNSRILILGTMPSPVSRKEGFYYAHPQNRFWSVLAAVYGTETPYGTEQRKAFLRERGIALWDVLASCYIEGASDASIKNAEPNSIRYVLERAPIAAIFTTGTKAAQLYHWLCYPDTGVKAHALPSTSPANAAWSFDRLVEEYKVILDV